MDEAPQVIRCAGCNYVITEQEPGVWVALSDDCYAGGVHMPPSQPEAPLSEVWMIRHKHQPDQWWSITRGWTTKGFAHIWVREPRAFNEDQMVVRYVETPF